VINARLGLVVKVTTRLGLFQALGDAQWEPVLGPLGVYIWKRAQFGLQN
jgi:hypothetical protein